MDKKELANHLRLVSECCDDPISASVSAWAIQEEFDRLNENRKSN